ncbi:MAG: hypothetical protein R3F08_01605 [Dokdonella sp.]|nr:hypothetical protein [Dokdonella sp.]
MARVYFDIVLATGDCLMRRVLRFLLGAALMILGFLFVWAGGSLVEAIRDSSLGGPEPAAQSWRWHRALTPAFEKWARARRSNDAAKHLSLNNISGTEWPLFGAVYYLRATENLDQAWQRSPRGEQPSKYARRAIDAAADLLADPAQADWVVRHWGKSDYIKKENVFYRMLLIDGLASQWSLLGSTPHADLLREQVTGLATELAESANGLLADYPQQTFPADVAAAWHAIRRADKFLGTDHDEMAKTAIRGFVGTMAPDGELPPYAWFGDPIVATPVRGSANAWLLHHAPFLWPDAARLWFSAHNRRFWQPSGWLAGYREYDQLDQPWFEMDVDSGPVVGGLGTSASAFGIGATRSMGDTRKARKLSLQAIAASWPLPNGRLLVPMLLSDSLNAPLLGEAAMLYNLSQPVATGLVLTEEPESLSDVPYAVWTVLLLQIVFGIAMILRGAKSMNHVVRSRAQTTRTPTIRSPRSPDCRIRRRLGW